MGSRMSTTHELPTATPDLWPIPGSTSIASCRGSTSTRACSPSRSEPRGAAARAVQVPRDLLEQPRRVLHGAGGGGPGRPRGRPAALHARTSSRATRCSTGSPAGVRALTAEQSRVWQRGDPSRPSPPGRHRGGVATRTSATDERRRRSTSSSIARSTPSSRRWRSAPGLPFPYISGLSLNLGLRVRDPVKGETRFARIKVPPAAAALPARGRPPLGAARGRDRVCHVDRLFPGMQVLDTSRFRVTRDADFSISDESDDLLGAVEAQLQPPPLRPRRALGGRGRTRPRGSSRT